MPGQIRMFVTPADKDNGIDKRIGGGIVYTNVHEPPPPLQWNKLKIMI